MKIIETIVPVWDSIEDDFRWYSATADEVMHCYGAAYAAEVDAVMRLDGEEFKRAVLDDTPHALIVNLKEIACYYTEYTPRAQATKTMLR